MSIPPHWVQEAASLPVAFAQVREDPLVDRWVVDQLPIDAHVIMIASGGCTAAFLATAPNVAHIHLVDANPAQLALSKLKLRLLNTAKPGARRALLGHAPLAVETRRSRLIDELSNLNLPPDALGPVDTVARLGPDQAGRYECVFAALRHALTDVASELESLLRLDDPIEQSTRVVPGTLLGDRLDQAFDSVMALPHLVHLFGSEATNNPAEPFSRHFVRRLRHTLGSLPAHRNLYLWQMLLGRNPADVSSPWLTAPIPPRLPRIRCSTMFMADALAQDSNAYDFVHLSNILDWLTPLQARQTLDHARQALRPGGWVLIRQLNSTVDIPDAGRDFEWLYTDAEQLHARDRSFFYRSLHLGRKR